MEDHGIFYSRNLKSYPNFCQRIHFFLSPSSEVKRKLQKLISLGRTKGEAAYRLACQKFSAKEYLGFSVIKPLEGCPVGRTILRSFAEDAGNGEKRRFGCTRLYNTHLAGIELTVRGLIFQQQDTGVSACATTALWSALNKLRDYEDIAASTPARITNLASQFTLPFGRAMPSEGLSIDQMCQAVQALGVSPNLYKADEFAVAKGYIHSATASNVPSVLILYNEKQQAHHAVTVTGMKINANQKYELLKPGLGDRAGEMIALYLHDDRLGPYVKATIKRETRSNRMKLKLVCSIDDAVGGACTEEEWLLTHILIPMHGKVRLTFSGLREIAQNAAGKVRALREVYLGPNKAGDVAFETLIIRSHTFIEKHFLSSDNSLKGVSISLS